MLLGYFKKGKQSNQKLAEALFTNSITTSRNVLVQKIWHPKVTDEMLFATFEKEEDIDFVNYVIDNVIHSHQRVNSLKKVEDIILDPNGCTLKECLELGRQDMAKKYRTMTSIPLTREEEQMQQLDQARLRFKTGEPVRLIIQDDEDDEAPGIPLNTNIWKSPLIEKVGYTWYRTVWFRVNFAYKFLRQYQSIFKQKNLFIERKVKMFVDLHLPIVQYLDSLSDPADKYIDPNMLHFEDPDTTMPDDYDFIKIEKETFKVRDTPLEMIEKHFPNLKWRVEQLLSSVNETWDRFIDDIWAPLTEDKISIGTHSIYLSCIRILNQCKRCMKLETTPLEICDALWFYYVSFTEFFYNCGPTYTDEYILTPTTSKQQRGGGMTIGSRLSPWEMYGTNLDVRCFSANDLPNAFHILIRITLYGEQNMPNFVFGKVFQKSLPFACQRRHLIRLVVHSLNTDNAFWKIFSKLFWCALASLYPHYLTDDPRERNQLSMRDLLRIKDITDSKERVIQAITAKQAGFEQFVGGNGGAVGPGVAAEGGVVGKSAGASGGPLIVHSVFRLHTLFMAHLNPIYIYTAKQCIDWDYFWNNSIRLADIIREHDMFADDAFALARKELSKTVKSPHSKVHRIRKFSKAVCIMRLLRETLLKVIIADDHVRRQNQPYLKELLTNEDTKLASRFEQEKVIKRIQESLHEFDRREAIAKQIEYNDIVIKMYDEVFSTTYYKAALVNLLIRMPAEDRVLPKGFNVLTLPEYGNVSERGIQAITKLTEIYYDGAIPRDFQACVDSLVLTDFMVILYYFNIVVKLEKLHFVPLDADTVKRTDYAMMNTRYALMPDQKLSPDVFNVCVSLCCEKVCNLTGFGKYGSKKITYDLEKQCFVCAHKKKQKKLLTKEEEEQEQDDDEEEEEEEDDEDEEDEEDEDNDQDNLENVLNVQLDQIEDIVFLKPSDFMNDVATKHGRGTKKTKEQMFKKEMRNKRKHFLKIPCNQPVLIVPLRGRALIWGNVLQKKSKYMFCPQCGALHLYTVLNFANAENGKYRCNECARKEVRHLPYRTCAYCQNSFIITGKEENHLLLIMDQEKAKTEWLYFCRTHYYLACRHNYNLTRKDLWQEIETSAQKKMLDFAKKQ